MERRIERGVENDWNVVLRRFFRVNLFPLNELRAQTAVMRCRYEIAIVCDVYFTRLWFSNTEINGLNSAKSWRNPPRCSDGQYSPRLGFRVRDFTTEKYIITYKIKRQNLCLEQCKYSQHFYCISILHFWSIRCALSVNSPPACAGYSRFFYVYFWERLNRQQLVQISYTCDVFQYNLM